MTPQELLLEVFCLVDDELQALNLGRLRQRGSTTALSDSEVITIELVGAFWKLGTDQDLFRHFRRYHAAEFSALARLDRTAFTRQAANLWRVKQLIQARLAEQLRRRRPGLAGGQPAHRRLPVRPRHLLSALRRPSRLRLLPPAQAHLLWLPLAPARQPRRRHPGLPTGAGAGQREGGATELGLLSGTTGIGDRNYYSPELRERLAQGGWRCWRRTTTRARIPTADGRRS